MSSAQNISTERARLWLPMQGQFRQDVGSNLLTNGDFETGSYIPWVLASSPTLTIEATGAAVGTYWLKVAYGGVANPFVSQSVLSVGQYFRIVGWGRGQGSGIAVPYVYNGGVKWSGTVSTSWQYFSTVFLAASQMLAIGGPALVPAFVGFDGLSAMEYPLTTHNLGGYSGAPTYVRVGDGHTSTTFPTQRVQTRGLQFDGGDYLRAPLDFTYDQPFTIAVLTSAPMTAAAWLAATYDSATARGVRFGSAGSGALTAGIYDSGGASISITSASSYIPTDKKPRLYCMTYDGSKVPGGLSMSIDDVVVPATTGGTILASSISSGRDLLIGGRWNGATPTELLSSGTNIWCAAEYPTVLDAYERRLLREKMMQEVAVL